MADPTLPTHADLYQAFQDETRDRDPRLTDWSEGSALDALAGGGAALADEVNAVTVDVFKTTFLDTCEDNEIDAWASDHYGDEIPRKDASAATGEVTLTRTDSSGDYPILAGTEVSGTVHGETITVTTDALTQIDDGETAVTTSATATTTGTTGNIAAAVLDTIGDATLLVTNAARFTGGADEESDARYRARVKAYPQTLRRGTVEALREGALRVGGVVFATVSESFTAPANGGYVAVYVGDPDARANSTLTALVDAELDNWRAAGIQVLVFAATRQEIPLSLALTVRAGADQAAIRAAVTTAVLAYTDDLDPNAVLYTAPVITAAMGAHSDILDADLVTPTDDVTPTAEQNALRVTTSDLTLTLIEGS